jgi:ATP-dependent Clp protease protease subunit
MKLSVATCLVASGAPVTKSWTVALRAPTAESLEIAIYDVIGASIFGDGITAQGVLDKLRATPKAKQITLRVNSQGGVVDEAKAMVNLLESLATSGVKIEAFVDGIAASSASYLLTAASRVVMPANTFQMLHQVRGMTRGSAADHEVTAKLIRATNDQMAAGYAAASARRGKSKTKADYLAAFEAGDMYLTADEAIEWGLADEKTEPAKMAACLADISGLESAPEALRGAPYIATPQQLVAVTEPSPQQSPATPASPPVAATATTGDTREGTEAMKMISLVAVAALLGMSADQIERAEEQDVLEALKKLKAKASTEPVASVAVSGVTLVGVATEAEAAVKIQDLQRGVMHVLGMTGKPSIAEAMPVLMGWKAGSEQAIEAMKKVASLTEETRVARRDAAITASNIPPVRHEWARTVFPTAEAVESFSAGLPAGFFNAITEPKGDGSGVTLSAADRVVCKNLGMSEEAFLAEKKLQAARSGAQVGG